MLDGHFFSFFGVQLIARPSGVLWWPEERVLCVSDLHLGKSDRLARRSGVLVPPYETIDTLQRLRKEIELLEPDIVICLGDNFDDLEAADSLSLADRLCLSQLQTDRMWIWIQGNHDLGVGKLTGQYLEEYNFKFENPKYFRHLAFWLDIVIINFLMMLNQEDDIKSDYSIKCERKRYIKRKMC